MAGTPSPLPEKQEALPPRRVASHWVSYCAAPEVHDRPEPETGFFSGPDSRARGGALIANDTSVISASHEQDSSLVPTSRCLSQGAGCANNFGRIRNTYSCIQELPPANKS